MNQSDCLVMMSVSTCTMNEDGLMVANVQYTPSQLELHKLGHDIDHEKLVARESVFAASRLFLRQPTSRGQ